VTTLPPLIVGTPKQGPLYTKQPARIQHDGLCVTQTGLAYCWCFCDKCWQNCGQTSNGQRKGNCICDHCPCGQRAIR
jgi:hypothetical protein